jgi:alpha-L-fucosidase
MKPQFGKFTSAFGVRFARSVRSGMLVAGLFFFSHAVRTATAFNGMEVIDVPIAQGPCAPNWKSLGDHFKTPTWWREAKIGMWLHWGPQSVGEDGDWYAKWIYMPRHAWPNYTNVYKNHLKRFGHPSEFGFKDVLPLWKAENWDPEKLMALYKRAGARYVIAQGMHHDNFDLWDSKYQPWNAVRIGPQRDIVGGWKKAADKEGMRFGIAFHGDYSLWWYQPAFLSDLDGPLKGVPYDAAQTYTNKDFWWQKMGLDLKDLYGIDLKDDVVYPTNFTGDPIDYRMDKPLAHGIPNGDLKKNRAFAVWYVTKWTRRVIDAIDQFDPDFIYFDGGGSYPFCGHGTGKGLRADATPRVIAHLYNSCMARNGGQLDAMAFTKGNEDSRAVAVNVESRFPADIKSDCAWQTEVGLGEWFYKAGTFYDSGMVIHQLLEAVSRDGNYAINIPLKPSGGLDPGGLQVLKDMGDWMDVNGAGIHGSSAWDVWGEGQVVMKSGNLGPEQARTPYTSEDIRFTAKDGSVYAFLLAWPKNGCAVIRSLAEGAGNISRVRLLGSPAKLVWKQTTNGLVVNLPATKPGQFAHCLEICGQNLHAVKRVPSKTN